MSAGQDPTPIRRGLAGRVLGDRYRVTRMVSAGANTLIADAEDLEVQRAVTVKLVRPEWAESEEFRGRFATAMRKMSTLSNQHIAAVYDWGEEEVGKRTTVYAVVEHLSGGSLRDLFDRGRYLDPSQALVVGLEACRGLDYAHREGLVHTELTPSKLVFGDDRRLRIVDFGLAQLLGAEDWSEPATVATHVARYSSPEQALAKPLDGKTDVYSLALILVEAVTGKVPFAERSTVATLSARVGRLMPASADLGQLAAVLEKAGRPDPADRSTAAELGRSLVRAAETLPRPKPIPILAMAPFVDDPNRMRRPNDPTGGIARPDDAPAPAVLAAPTVATTPEEQAADASLVAAGVARTGGGDALPPPAEPPAAVLYDGDADRTKDELAELGRPVAAVEAPPLVEEAAPAPEPPPPQRRRRRWLPWVIALAVLAALAGLALLALQLFEVPTHPVPALVGLDEAAARAQTAEFDWDIDIQTERSDEQPAVGAIIRTAPVAGEELAEGEPFLVIVSEGPEFRQLPELANLTRAEAETALAELSLVALPATEQHDEVVPPGSVISWSVPADPSLGVGGDVLPGAEVAIVVSSGPAPRTVPELAGQTTEAASAALAAIQLVPAVAEPVFSDTIPTGSVVSIDPVAGTQLERGATVTMVPSKGVDLVTMPNLSGLTLAQAQESLTAAGLQVGALLGNSQGLFVSATVAGDPADPGEQFRRGTAIDMVFF